MVTVFWNPNAAAIAQVDTLTVAGVPAAGNTISATINTKSVTYTLIGGDTTVTAAAGLQALLNSKSTVPPEFNEITWTVSSNVITATAVTPGTPFTLTASATGGGATITRASVTANVSPSDVNNASNWLRSGSASLPQNGDDVVVANSSVSLLWNLSSLAAVQFNSYTRWQSFTGTIGLPLLNANGYIEYRPTDFQFTTSGVGSPKVILGAGNIGSGPTRERYSLGANQYTFTVLGAGSPADTYSVHLVATNASNVLTVLNCSVGVAMQTGQTSSLASATVDGGGSLNLGSGVTFSGTLTLQGSSACNTYCSPATSIILQNGSSLTVLQDGLTFPSITAQNGSSISWQAGGTITSLNLKSSSTFDKSDDLRTLTITNATVEGDTCQILDPNSVITMTNAMTVNGQVSSGWFNTGPGRTWKVV
jgi:hypothetical protein